MNLYEIVGDLDICILPDLDAEDKLFFVSFAADRIFVRYDDVSSPRKCIYLVYQDQVANFISYDTEAPFVPPAVCHLPRYNSRICLYPRVNRRYSRLVVLGEEFAFIVQTKTQTKQITVRELNLDELEVVIQAGLERADDIIIGAIEEEQLGEG